eukprot:m.286653 g.286653  ORF g.286653 m.286653 type:complete len:895 (-) comp11615_c0_seq1:268-2952(-)
MSRAVIAVVAVAALAVCAQAQTSCTGRDVDFCFALRDCFWNELVGECDHLGCTAYDRYSACKADPNGYGPCTWSWEINYCTPRDQPIPCSVYTDDCPRDRCSYDDVLSRCTEIGKLVACSEFDDQACSQQDHCQWFPEAGECLAKGTIPACSLFIEPDVCNKATDVNGNLRCKYHTETEPQLCWPIGLEVPCLGFSDVDCTKNPDRCLLYNLGNDAEQCFTIEPPPPCEYFQTPEACPQGRCAFETVCHDAGVPVDCVDLGREGPDTCPSTRCRWYDDFCHDKDQPVDCSFFYYGSSDCNKDLGCYPDCDNSLCVPCTSVNCVDTPCTNTTDRPIDNCGVLPKEECESHLDCVWDSVVDLCHDPNTPIACFYYSFEADCSSQNDCKWVSGQCIECSNPDAPGCDNNPSTTESPDDGQPCKSYDSFTCPQPRCELYYDVLTSSEKCIDGVCQDYYDQKQCERVKPCDWSMKLGVCFNTTTGVPCFDLSDAPSCNGESNCFWNSTYYRCEAKDSGKACDTYNAGNCPQRCEFDFMTNRCSDRGCNSYFSETECVAAGCQYLDGICFKDNGGACSDYKEMFSCPGNRCEWDFNTNTCTKLSCNAPIFDQARCQALGCDYDGVQCYKDSNKPCYQYKTMGDCAVNRCSFVDINGENICQNKVCAETIAEASCTKLSTDCQWDSDTYSCFNKTITSCAGLSPRECVTPSCAYDYQYQKCRKKICTDYFDDISCTGNTGLNCVWDSTYDVCYTKGDNVPCSVFSYTTDCPNYCAKVGEICYGKRDGVPCGEIFDSTLCAAQKPCIWNSKIYECDFRNARRSLEDDYVSVMLARERARNPLFAGYSRATAFHFHGRAMSANKVRKELSSRRTAIQKNAETIAKQAEAAKNTAHKPVAVARQ